MKKLSIIIPVFKVERYIKNCLNSILSQKYNEEDVEIIIVNDGTPDNSMTIVQECISGCNNVIIINQDNQGLSVARNNGLKVANGDYVWFVDSDDSLADEAIDKVLTIIDKNSGKMDVISTLLNRVCETTEDENKDSRNKYLSGRTFVQGKDFLFDEGCYAPIQQHIFRLDFLKKNNLIFYPGIYHEDGEFSFRAFYLASNVYLLDDHLYNYLLREGSIMSTKTIKNAYDLVTVYKSLKAFGESFISEGDMKYWNGLISKILFLSLTWSKNLVGTIEFDSFYNGNRALFKAHMFDCVHSKYFHINDLKKNLLLIVSPKWYLKRLL